MGNDGGSIPTRRELVKEAARNPTTAELKESRQEQQEYHWTTDPISRTPLAAPIVSDAHGRLYNKETMLEYLATGARQADADAATAGAVTGLRDLVEVRFETDTSSDGRGGSWKCPITNARLGPGSKAVYLVPCGHAFAGAAIREVAGERCVVCDTAYAANDVIPILPTAETEIARLALRAKGLRERGLTHSLRKAGGKEKKRKKRGEEAGEGKGADEGAAGINASSAAASVSAKVKQDQDAAAKRRKTESENVRSLFSSQDGDPTRRRHGADFMTRGFTVGGGSKR